MRAEVARRVGEGDGAMPGQIPFTPRAKRVLELALREALSLGHNYIGTEHVLLGLVCENEGVAMGILRDFDADAEKIRNEVIRMLSGPPQRQRSSSVKNGDEIDLLDKAIAEVNLLSPLVAEAIDGSEYERAAVLRDIQQKLMKVVREIHRGTSDIGQEPLPPSDAGPEAQRWQYDVRTLEGPTVSWPEQIAAWRLDGWEVLAVVLEESTHRALVERRV